MLFFSVIPSGSYTKGRVRIVIYEAKHLLLLSIHCDVEMRGALDCWRRELLLCRGLCDLLLESGRCSCFGSGVMFIPSFHGELKRRERGRISKEPI